MEETLPTDDSAATAQTARGPRGVPLLGVGLALMRNPLGFLSDIRQYSPVAAIPLGRKKAFFAISPAAVQRLLQEGHRVYEKEPFAAVEPLIGNGLFMSTGAFWLKQRRLMQPAFHRSRLAALASTMTALTTERLDTWAAAAARAEPIDLATGIVHLTERIAARTLFSSEIGSDVDTVIRSLTGVFSYLNSRSSFGVQLPAWVPTRRQRDYQASLERLNTMVYAIINGRRQHPADQDDLLAMLLEARDEETGTGMTDKQLRDEMMTLFIAGQENTATTLLWICILLQQSPNAAQALYAEVDAVLQGRTPTIGDLAGLAYTRAVIDEAMRLYPPAWITSRVATQNDLLDGVRIPAGALILASSYTTQRDPRYWPNADQFMPERFLAGAADPERPKYAYFPFGGGPRFCIGQSFALMETTLVLAMLVQRYTFQIAANANLTPSAGISLRPRGPIPVLLTPRPAPPKAAGNADTASG